MSYGVLMKAIKERNNDGEYYTLRHDTPDVCYSKAKDMWRHYEIVTGEKATDPETSAFSCSC